MFDWFNSVCVDFVRWFCDLRPSDLLLISLIVFEFTLAVSMILSLFYYRR